MISSWVNASGNEARITLVIRGPTGRTLQVEAVVDTGFTNFLTLRDRHIADLELQWQGTASAQLADSRSTTADIYMAQAMWDGKSVTIAVAALQSIPLVGMQLMKNYRLTIDVVPGGLLQLEQLPSVE